MRKDVLSGKQGLGAAMLIVRGKRVRGERARDVRCQTRRCQTYYTCFLRRLRLQPSSVYFYIKKTDVVGSFWAADGKSIDIMFYFEVVTVASWLQV